jgi:transcriptional regulator with XRE-family HTH domain
VETNEPHAVIKRIKEIMARENVSTVSALARIAGVHRSTLSTLLNAAAPNPTLDVFDKLVLYWLSVNETGGWVDERTG